VASSSGHSNRICSNTSNCSGKYSFIIPWSLLTLFTFVCTDKYE
jgi:hypothetical protein